MASDGSDSSTEHRVRPDTQPRRQQRLVEVTMPPSLRWLSTLPLMSHEMALSNLSTPPSRLPQPRPVPSLRDTPPTPPTLTPEQHRTIKNLMEACGALHQQGEDHLADLVDRIGMTVMQTYLK